MRESMAQLTLRFSASRAVSEYTEKHYLPAAAAYHARRANESAIGRRLVDWEHALARKWDGLAFGEMKLETQGDQHMPDRK